MKVSVSTEVSSKDPTFKQAVQKALQDPVFASGFISYIQNRQEQQRSDK